MDKLKQVLKYQFWILLGLAIIFPLVGWFLASSGMAKSFEDREKKLNGQLGQLKASAADPNGHWESELKKVNSVQELEMLKARVALWEMQQPLKVWPEKMSTTDPQKFTDPDKGYYRKNYNSFRQEIFEQLDPVVEEGEDGRRHGKVKMSLEAFPFSEAVGRQRATNPTNEEIEEAQEDLWLSNALVQAVAYMNRDAVSQLDAVIPEITVFNLVGGNKSGTGPAKKAAKANSSSGDGGGTAAMGAQMADMAKSALKDSGFLNKSGTSGGGGAGGDVGTVGVIPSVTFDPVDEFGDPGEPARRYIDKSDDVRTRGFYLELKIEQTRVPELLVVLSSLDWPVRVSRVHVADVREEELLAADQAGGIGAGAGGSGASGMGGMGMMGGMGGGGNAMKAMSESMSKMGKQGGGGGGTGASASVGGALLGGGTKIAAGGTGGGANTTGGILGGGGLEDVSQALPKVDALANPNLVSLAIDGWFTIYVMPKQEVLDKVFPPATPGTQNETPATTSNAADNNASGNGTSTAGSVEDQSNSGAGAPASPAVEESVNETATPSEQTDSETGDEAATDTAKDGGEAKPESSGSASDPAKPASPNQ